MKSLLNIVVIILGAIFLINIFGPREKVDWEISFSETDIGPDVNAYLENVESRYNDIIEGAEKEVIWAASPGTKTPLSIVYIHGFSATKQEIRPVPDNVASALGANLFYTRLTGHGRGGPAMVQSTANDWLNDVAEAIAIGRQIGEKVIVIATSHGGTMTAMSAVNPDVMSEVAGIVFVAPNFGLVSKSSFLLTIPFAEQIVPLLAGDERSWEPLNAEHGKWWTTTYPTKAALPLAASVRAAIELPFDTVLTPAFFIFSDADMVVKTSATREIASIWGGPSEIWPVELGEGDDPSAHVIAGDIMSPSMNAPMTDRILAWIGTL